MCSFDIDSDYLAIRNQRLATSYQDSAVRRFGDDLPRAVEWLEIERAQESYIAANARHVPSVTMAKRHIAAINGAIAALANR